MCYKCLCHRCRKIFYPPDLGDYVYKMNGYYFCSWSCYRRYQQEKERLKRERLKDGKKKPV